jgi:hypothetical protein
MRGITEERLKFIFQSLYWCSEGCEDTLNKLLRECQEINPWQPIETAPKDRKVLLFYPPTPRDEPKTIIGYADWHNGYVSCNPTHYQELPKGPER